MNFFKNLGKKITDAIAEREIIDVSLGSRLWLIVGQKTTWYWFRLFYKNYEFCVMENWIGEEELSIYICPYCKKDLQNAESWGFHVNVCKEKEKEMSNCYKENYFSKKCFDCKNKMICRDKVYDDLLKQFEGKEEK